MKDDWLLMQSYRYWYIYLFNLNNIVLPCKVEEFDKVCLINNS